jgi:hypothetical protein
MVPFKSNFGKCKLYPNDKQQVSGRLVGWRRQAITVHSLTSVEGVTRTSSQLRIQGRGSVGAGCLGQQVPRSGASIPLGNSSGVGERTVRS